MQTRYIKRVVWTAAAAASMLLCGAAQAALQDRDLNGDTLVDAFYDTDLDITWLRDAGLFAGGYWADANTWANTLVVSGVSGWRLPMGDTCSPYNCTGSEMGHLWYVDLGNAAGGPITNSGDFQTLRAFPIQGNGGYYWSGTDDVTDSSFAYVFAMYWGVQAGYNKLGFSWAMAVHPGDVGAVPEPETYALMLVGLTALSLAARRRPR